MSTDTDPAQDAPQDDPTPTLGDCVAGDGPVSPFESSVQDEHGIWHTPCYDESVHRG